MFHVKQSSGRQEAVIPAVDGEDLLGRFGSVRVPPGKSDTEGPGC